MCVQVSCEWVFVSDFVSFLFLYQSLWARQLLMSNSFCCVPFHRSSCVYLIKSYKLANCEFSVVCAPIANGNISYSSYIFGIYDAFFNDYSVPLRFFFWSPFFNSHSVFIFSGIHEKIITKKDKNKNISIYLKSRCFNTFFEQIISYINY